jgi:hypothetical protein
VSDSVNALVPRFRLVMVQEVGMFPTPAIASGPGELGKHGSLSSRKFGSAENELGNERRDRILRANGDGQSRRNAHRDEFSLVRKVEERDG